MNEQKNLVWEDMSEDERLDWLRNNHLISVKTWAKQKYNIDLDMDSEKVQIGYVD